MSSYINPVIVSNASSVEVRVNKLLPLACVLVACVCVAFVLVSLSDASLAKQEEQIRLLRIDRLQLARTLGVVKEHDTLLDSIIDDTRNESLITIDVVEALRHFAKESKVPVVELKVSNVTAEKAVSHGQDGREVDTLLRFNFDVTAKRVEFLLSLFDAVSVAAGWRPVDIRACSLNRVAYSSGISMSCTFDLHLHEKLHR